jgi:prepilin-type N-terminal cleavage/methylation domain-containing protein
MHGSGWRRARAGFTLLEVVIALALLGLVLAALSQGVRGALIGNDRAGGMQTALELAESRLAQLGVSGKLEAGTESGDAGALHWTTRVEPYGEAIDAPDLPLLFRLRVTVSWRQRAAMRDITLETLRLGGP